MLSAKGKGELQTYWVELRDVTSSTKSDNEETKSHSTVVLSGKLENEIGGHVERSAELLAVFLKAMIARRRSLGIQADSAAEVKLVEESCSQKAGYFLDEVQDIISFIEVDASRDENSADDDLEEAVKSQLYHYILTLQSLYQENSFHNFEHAVRTAEFVAILLTDLLSTEGGDPIQDAVKTRLGSNPVIKFASAFSELIFCADHQGIPNAQLVRESATLAQAYRRKNVTEQNALDIAWNLLMTDSFTDLRRAIYANKKEFSLFRQFLVNCVVSTEILD